MTPYDDMDIAWRHQAAITWSNVALFSVSPTAAQVEQSPPYWHYPESNELNSLISYDSTIGKGDG